MIDTFKHDLSIGLNVELLVLEKLKLKYPSSTIVNAFKGYDIWIPETNKSVEVKYDKKSNETGNIVIEIEFNGKPSALITTQADYWVFYDDNVFVSLKPIDIIKCIFDCKLQYVEFIGSGDSKSKKAFLVNKEILFSYGSLFK
jgi:hypothetical protein